MGSRPAIRGAPPPRWDPDNTDTKKRRRFQGPQPARGTLPLRVWLRPERPSRVNDSWGRVDALLGGFSDERRHEALSGVHHARPRAGGEDQDPDILAPTEGPIPLYCAGVVGDGPGDGAIAIRAAF